MKKLHIGISTLVLALLIGLSFDQTIQAQTPTVSQPPPIPESVFPFGGFDIGTLNGITLDPDPNSTYHSRGIGFLSMLSQYGFNSIYHVANYDFPYNSSRTNFQLRQALAMPAGMASYQGMEYTDLQSTFIGNFRGARMGYEKDYFLLSSESGNFDYQTASTSVLSHYDNMTQTTLPGAAGIPIGREWFAKYDRVLPEHEIIAVTESDEGLDHLLAASDASHNNNQNFAVLDFIFRIDGTEPNQLLGNTVSDHTNAVLFTVEASVDGSALTKRDITWADCAVPTYKKNEIPTIKRFPDAKVGAPQDYVVVSLNLPLPSSYTSSTFVFKVVGKGACGIYIRGFRLRSKMADEILTGAKDGDILSGLPDPPNNLAHNGKGLLGIRNTLNQTGASKNTPAITWGGELQPDGYRVMAYIDNLFHKVSGKHIYNFISKSSGNYAFWRAIYEDQNGIPPPNIMEENFWMYGYDSRTSPHKFPYVAGDAIPYSYKHQPDPDHPGSYREYDDLGFTLVSDKLFSGTWVNGALVGPPGYVEYTTRMQGDYPNQLTRPFFSYYDYASNECASSAEVAFRHTGKPPTRWFALVSAITTLNSQGDFAPPNTSSTLLDARNEVWGVAKDGPAAFAAYVHGGKGDYRDYLKGHSSFSDLAANGTYHLDQRGPNAAEIRADVWDAIAWGATGIYFNPIGSDGGANIGIGGNDFGNPDPNITPSPTGLYDGPDNRTNATERHGFMTVPYGSTCDHASEFINANGTTASPSWDIRLIALKEYLDMTPDQRGAYLSDNSKLSPYQPMPMGQTAQSYLPSVSSFQGYLNNGMAVTIQVGTNKDIDPSQNKWIDYKLSAGNKADGVTPCDPDFCGWNTTWWASSSMIPTTAQNIQSMRIDNLFNSNTTVGHPLLSIDLAPSIPTFYGFQDKWVGATTAIHDLLRIAPTLTKLSWNKTISLMTLDAVDHATGVFDPTYPIRECIVSGENRTSQKVRRYDWTPSTGYILRTTGDAYAGYDGTIDNSAYDNPSMSDQSSRQNSADELFYQLGAFTGSANPKERYIVIANRRTWPVRFDSVNGARHSILSTDQGDNLFGAIDVRQFNFRVNWGMIHDSIGAVGYYSVTNMRTGVETIIPDNDATVFSTILEPGEGTLWRIRPAYGVIGGRTSDAGMTYNNGHRIAELSNGQRIMVWEKQGNIEYAFVNSPGQTGEDNFVTPSSENVLYPKPTGKSEVNPSVTSKPSLDGSRDTIVVIWNELESTTDHSRNVMCAYGTSPVAGTRSLTTSTALLATVPWDPKNGTNHVVAASVTPLRDGFFAAWAYPNPTLGASPLPYIQPALISPTHSIRLLSPLRAGSTSSTLKVCLFPTVATRDESSILGTSERLHIAWEEDYVDPMSNLSSEVYYKRYTHSFASSSTDAVDETFVIERVSKQLVSCNHHHPNIAVTNPHDEYHPVIQTVGEPLVTWETVMDHRVCDEGYGWLNIADVVVMERERFGDGIGWSAFNSFYPKKDNLPLPLIKTSQWASPNSLKRTDCLVFQDSANQEVHIRRSIRDMFLPPTWSAARLLEAGRTPNLTQPFEEKIDPATGTFTYRTSIEGEDGLFYAKVTAKETPPAEITEKPQLVTALGGSKTLNCETGLVYMAGRGSVGRPDSPEPWDPSADSNSRKSIDWLYRDLGLDGSGLPYQIGSNSGHATYGWPITEDSIRTGYFKFIAGDEIHIPIERIMFDSISVMQLLTDSQHFVSFTMELKDSANDQVLQVLDNIVVKGNSNVTFELPCPVGVAMQAHPLSAAHLGSGTGFLTIVAKKDSLTQLDFYQSQQFIDAPPPDLVPQDSSSFKTGGGGRADASAGSVELKVYPNPFNPSTTIELRGPSDLGTRVELMNVLGQSVRVLYDGGIPKSGLLKLKVEGSQLTSGTYFIRASGGNSVVTKRIQLVR